MKVRDSIGYGDSIHKKSNRISLRGKRSKKPALSTTKLKEYCSETSLHGPKYITENGSNAIQK